MQEWAAAELQTAGLGDPRRGRRLIRLVEALAAQPAASVPQACGSWAATKAAYRFWENDHISATAIRAAHTDATRLRLPANAPILAIQDTTEADFTHHPSTTDLGPLSHPKRYGLHIHSTLAVTLTGVPVGLLDQTVWARDPDQVGRRHTRRQRPTAEKESQRWLDAHAARLAALPPDHPVITVADREADIYDLFAQERRPGADLLIRATHDRKVDHASGYLWAVVQQAPVQGRRSLAVGRTPLRVPRTAELTIRWVAVRLQPPRHQVQRTHTQPVPVTAILVEEVGAPTGATALQWLLLTTLPVPDVTTAWELVRWYTYRWLIERYHFVLKSGCRLEQLQLGSADQIERALATYSIVAWRLLWLTYQARVAPDQPCRVALEPDEWQALVVTMTQPVAPPTTPPTLQQAVRWIAQLGGFLARRGDGDPGVQTLWQGLRRLHDITSTWRLARTTFAAAPPDPLVGNA